MVLGSSLVAVTSPSDFAPASSKEFLDIQETMERDMVKFLWDECIPHDFVRYMYKEDNYTEISKSILNIKI